MVFYNILYSILYNKLENQTKNKLHYNTNYIILGASGTRLWVVLKF